MYQIPASEADFILTRNHPSKSAKLELRYLRIQPCVLVSPSQVLRTLSEKLRHLAVDEPFKTAAPEAKVLESLRGDIP